MNAGTKRGFTVVELLVVITIIGILMSMIFPAVNRARSMARRAECVSNQKQIAQAVLSFATSKAGLMPPERSWAPGRRSSSWSQADYLIWVHPLLPNLGRSDVYDTVASSTDVRDVSVYIPLLVCPADRPSSTDGAPLSYVVNAGRRNAGSTSLPYDWRDNGSFSYDQQLSTDDRPAVRCTIDFIASHDGMATTLMLSENIDAEDWTSVATHYQSVMYWFPTTSPTVELNQDIGAQNYDHARPSSKHGGGFIVAFCDGHVRFISEKIAYKTYALLMTSNGRGARTPGSTDAGPIPTWQGNLLNEGSLEL